MNEEIKQDLINEKIKDENRSNQEMSYMGIVKALRTAKSSLSFIPNEMVANAIEDGLDDRSNLEDVLDVLLGRSRRNKKADMKKAFDLMGEQMDFIRKDIIGSSMRDKMTEDEEKEVIRIHGERYTNDDIPAYIRRR